MIKEEIKEIVRKWRPCQDRVIVIPDERSPETESGLFVGDEGEDTSQYGEVAAVGPGRPLENGSLSKMEVSVGERVLFGYYSGDDIVVDSKGKIHKFIAKSIPDDMLHVKVLLHDSILFRL